MQGRWRRFGALVIAPVTMVTMALLASAPAQAARTSGAGTTSRSSPSPLAGRAGHKGGHGGHDRLALDLLGKPGLAGSKAKPPQATLPADVRPACAPPKRGYAACMTLVRTNVRGRKGLYAAGSAPSGYGPPDLQSAYNLPSATAGSGQTVAIVDAGDDPTAEADLQVYRAQYGLPACTTANGCFEKVNQEGQQGSYPPVFSNWPAEESLDVDMVSAACPLCHIILVEANSAQNSDLYAAEDEAVALGAKYVSNSWGASEYSGETQDDQYFDHPGVVITAAGGDNGYLSRGTANWPAVSQYVTSVGGTSLYQNSSVTRGWTEAAWSGGGSGCSLYEPKPAWQHDSGCTEKMTTDVSAVGDPNTGVAIYDSTASICPTAGWCEVGGTSVATPLIASVYALAGPPRRAATRRPTPSSTPRTGSPPQPG